MSDLDKKLEDAYSYDFTPIVGGTKFETRVNIEAIKQAFIDDGWKKCTEVTGLDGRTSIHAHTLETDQVSQNIRPDVARIMTASEWEAEAIKDGWVKTLRVNDRTIIFNGKDNIGYVVYYPNEVMTGQEWYDRFMQEFKGWPSGAEVTVNVKSILDAAKKAAGIQ